MDIEDTEEEEGGEKQADEEKEKTAPEPEPAQKAKVTTPVKVGDFCRFWIPLLDLLAHDK